MYIEKVCVHRVQLMKNGGKNKCCIYNFGQCMCVYIYMYMCVYLFHGVCVCHSSLPLRKWEESMTMDHCGVVVLCPLFMYLRECTLFVCVLSHAGVTGE